MRVSVHSLKEWRQNFGRFFSVNRRLLWRLILFLAGAEAGCFLFRGDPERIRAALEEILAPVAVTGFDGMIHRLLVACCPVWLLLLILFPVGLTAWGMPVAAVIPPLFGMGFGVTASYYYSEGLKGVGYVALLLLPHTLVAAGALILASAAAGQMSGALCRGLMPRQGCCGGLWPEFKRYLARFLICGGLAFLAGALDAGGHLCFSKHFIFV